MTTWRKYTWIGGQHLNVPKRFALAIGVPFAAAAVLGGSVAFAASQQADPTPSTPSTPTAPANPSQPGGGNQNGQNGTPNGRTHDCPNMGGSKSGSSGSENGSSTNSAPQTGFHNRMRGNASQARYY